MIKYIFKLNANRILIFLVCADVCSGGLLQSVFINLEEQIDVTAQIFAAARLCVCVCVCVCMLKWSRYYRKFYWLYYLSCLSVVFSDNKVREHF